MHSSFNLDDFILDSNDFLQDYEIHSGKKTVNFIKILKKIIFVHFFIFFLVFYYFFLVIFLFFQP